MLQTIISRFPRPAGALCGGALPRLWLLFAPLLLHALVTAAQPLAAQEVPPASRSLLVAGLSGSPGATHRFAGGQLAVGGERFGVLGHAAYGSGNQFSSLLMGAGPSVRSAAPSSKARIPLELRAFAGWGRYRESLDDASSLSGAGETRSAWGPQAGATLLAPVGPVRAGVGVLAWGGRFASRTMERGVPVRGFRFILIVGR